MTLDQKRRKRCSRLMQSGAIAILALLAFAQPVTARPLHSDASTGPDRCTPAAAKQKLDVTVDPRIELLSIVQLLSGYVIGASLINSDATSYRRDIDVHFAPYRGHAAVKMFSEMYPNGFSYDAPAKAMLFLSDPPALRQLAPFSPDLEERAGGAERLKSFTAALRDFARETRFMSFYRAHRSSYDMMVASMCGQARNEDLVGALESYFGTSKHSYHVMLMPLFVELGFGTRVDRSDGPADAYQMLGRKSVRAGRPLFGSGGESSLRSFVWHEFGHSFVNPITATHRAEMMKYAALFGPIEDTMRGQGYGWEQTVNEHIIRAITSRLAARYVDEATAERELAADEGKGFIYIRPLAERLKKYETNRDKYPTFADFYPQLLEVLRDELKEKGLAKSWEHSYFVSADEDEKLPR